MQAALERFESSLPIHPYCTDDPSCGLCIRNRPQAIERSHIQLHGVTRRYIPFDVDRAGAFEAHEDASLPEPTIISINPVNSHAHLLYELETPVTFPDVYGRGKAHRKPQAYYNAVLEAYRAKLGADLSYAGMITKNPLRNDVWHVLACDRTYTLQELASYVDLKGARSHLFNRLACLPDFDSNTVILKGYRNQAAFDQGRKLAYRKVHSCTGPEDLHNTIMNCLAAINMQCRPAMSSRELQGIGKSITKWTWTRRDTIGKRHTWNVGIMGNPKMNNAAPEWDRLNETHQRQQLGAWHTAQTKREATEARITQAIEDMKAQGKKPTKTAVAKALGMSDRALRKDYSSLFL